jgi:hypothetical protein
MHRRPSRARARAKSRASLVSDDQIKAMRLNAAEPIVWELELTHRAAATAKALFQQLFHDKLERGSFYQIAAKQRIHRILVANILLNSRHFLRLSLSSNGYGGFYMPAASRFVIEAAKALDREGYVELITGIYFPERAKLKQTRLAPTEKLENLFFYDGFRINDIIIHGKPIRVVVLRNADGDEIPFSETKETLFLRERLESINAVNSNAKLQYRKVRRRQRRKQRVASVNSHLHAVFTRGSWQSCGRMYTGSNGYQSLTKRERGTIEINGESTVELDYAALHVRMIYDLMGIDCPNDPYALIHPDAARGADETMRDYVKTLIQTLLNSESEKVALQGIRFEANKKHKEYRRAIVERRGLTHEQMLQRTYRAHHMLRKWFCIQPCHRLQFLDSTIARDVVYHFTSQGIPCLPVHDSFIVQARFEEELRDAMSNCYYLHLGRYPVI